MAKSGKSSLPSGKVQNIRGNASMSKASDGSGRGKAPSCSNSKKK